MDKKEFIDKQAVNSELAKAAWEEAGGKKEAEELLAASTLWLKGRFLSSGRGGLWLVQWDCESDTLVRLKVVVVGKQIEGASPRLSPSHFEKQINRLQKSSRKLPTPRDKLNNTLEEIWEDSDSAIARALEEEDYDRLPAINKTIVENTLNFELNTNEVSSTLKRKIEQRDMTESEKDERLVLPCEVSIHPVKGFPIQKLRKGDKILARLPEIPTDMKNKLEVKEAVKRIEKIKDEETGLFPVKLISGKKSGDRSITLTFQLTPQVLGETSCGKDVGILVPEETEKKLANRSSKTGTIGKLINSYGTPIFLGILLIVLIIIGFLYLF